MSSAMPKAFCSNGVIAPATLALRHKISDSDEVMDDPAEYSSGPPPMFLFLEFDPVRSI
jgi:hypothetical protein